MLKRKTSTSCPITLIAASLCSFYLAQSSPAASILGWGSQRVDSAQLLTNPSNPFIAIAAGHAHSLALQRVCQYTLAGDLNDDCDVDFSDCAAIAGKWLVGVDFSHFAEMAANWLIDCNVEPPDPACIPK